MNKLTVALVLSFAPILVSAKGVDIEAGRADFETCRGCHSVPHYSNAYPTYNVPKVGGQVSGYVASALQAYRAGQRPHGTMKANAWNLTDSSIENIAAYLEKTSGNANAENFTGDVVAGKKLAEACSSCHKGKKEAQGGNIPVLAGQYENYLYKVMKDYQGGKRNNALMQSMVQSFSDADLKNIAAYFASQKGLASSQ